MSGKLRAPSDRNGGYREGVEDRCRWTARGWGQQGRVPAPEADGFMISTDVGQET